MSNATNYRAHRSHQRTSPRGSKTLSGQVHQGCGPKLVPERRSQTPPCAAGRRREDHLANGNVTQRANDDPIRLEFNRALAAAEAVISTYAAWGAKIQTGQIHYDLYNRMLEFSNLRMETAETCLQFARLGKVADALGLCRSLLEHYLLFILMCRGRKYFRLDNSQQQKSAAEFDAYYEQKQRELLDLQQKSTAACLAVEKYGRERRSLMYVFEGAKSEDDPSHIIPIHFFQFEEFRPDVMRLDPADYFDYLPRDNETASAMKKYRREDAFRYRHYLSYEGLLRCLELNDIMDGAARSRIDAHYTFLGQFLHPTHGAARQLHEQDNYHMGGTAVGLAQPYREDARLLVCLYVAYIAGGLVEEIASVLEQAPAKYIADPATGDVRRRARAIPTEFPYFWFVFNEAPLWDKFNHFIHASQTDRNRYREYSEVPTSAVLFDQHIYGHLQRALGGWENRVAGIYVSPLQRYAQ